MVNKDAYIAGWLAVMQAGCKQLRLRQPRDVAVDAEGRILVADRDNDRVVVMDRYLMEARQLLLPMVDEGLHGPCSLCLDWDRDRCYVGEWNAGRVFVFDHISNCALA